MVERAALEMRYTRKRIEGSNPPLSAEKRKSAVQVYLSKQIFIFMHRMPSADYRDYEEIPHFLLLFLPQRIDQHTACRKNIFATATANGGGDSTCSEVIA